ncbi:MAG: hypothetical protein HUU38_16340 [Anaerolineales bacterium]|jgi:hypothetical protein|nr:hypothetical protein [Anaerolineales bacterium]
MNPALLRINLFAIIGFGLLVCLFGLMLFFFRTQIAPYLRYFLPLPPLGVAAYVFVFNLYGFFGGQMPANKMTLVKELLIGTGVMTLIFGLTTLLLVLFLEITRRFG